MTCTTNFPLTDIASLLRDQINAELIGAVPLDKLEEEVMSIVHHKFDLLQEQLNKLAPEKHVVSQNLEGTKLETTLNNGDVFLTDFSGVLSNLLTSIVHIGTTQQRPVLGVTDMGVTYFDTTLATNGKPIWWNGSNWVDATGTAV